MIATLYIFSNNLDAELETPLIVSKMQENGSISFCWSDVPYATSYRVYRRSSEGQWHFVAVCPPGQQSFTETVAEDHTGYAVRACNVSGKHTTLSDMSVVIEVAGDADE